MGANHQASYTANLFSSLPENMISGRQSSYDPVPPEKYPGFRDEGRIDGQIAFRK
ncbi:hypothetical protein H3Z85_00620 [Chryseobacterium indologenes]|uniref:hypothetical protein n=1 Tax=Bacteroidota TaxID=976 RepID=UPI000B109D93|nr:MULTISPECIES: hypothetical protein [Bacteroidota]MBF6643656.1 hypothetical protein [Chryseobacterium indologenes]QPQ52064.1 hypothetical protein H3Z85_00620 [Chryseobacterium indologenes]